MIFDIIDGKANDDKQWIYSIVNNKKSSVDVEKFDYILRDAYNIGIKSIFFDAERLINTSRIIDGKLAFHSKNDTNLDGLFQSRYKLFKEVYYHRLSTAIDCMMIDCLQKSDPFFKFSEALYNKEEYEKCTDSYVLTMIESEKEPCLIEANQILENIK